MTWSEQLGTERRGLQVVRSLEELRSLDDLSTPHAVEVAWRRMELDGVVVVGRSAGIYIKEVESFDPRAEHALHCQLWLHGTAPLLLVVDPEQFRVYSSRPRKPGRASGKEACIEILDRVRQAIEISHLVEHVQLGDYFERHREHFLPRNAVDWHFRSLLEKTRNRLAALDGRVSLSKIHQLLVQVLFLRYLSDRRALCGGFFQRHLGVEADGLEAYLGMRKSARKSLGRVFRGLFDALGFAELSGFEDLAEDSALREEHFDLLVRFLLGEEVDTGQLALGDWVYDLSLLPVELISTVYQEFVSAEVANAKKEIGLVATPRFLAETVLDFAFDGLSLEKPRVLDPACGSGVFLVGSFNRLAHRLSTRGSDTSPRRALSTLAGLLREKIIGVELRPTACGLARLNLLHALLGHFSGEQLRTLLQDAAPTGEKGRAATQIYDGNFFDDRAGVPPSSFDLVIGNPPWSKDPDAMGDWLSEHPDIAIPDRGNLVYGFAFRAAEFLSSTGRACLLLDAKAMLTAPPAKAFAAQWFTKNRVDVLVNLTSLRAHLFGRRAGRAAAIFRFRSAEPKPSDALTYLTPAPSDGVRRGGLLDLSQARSQRIVYSEVLGSARRGNLSHVWRVRLHGTGRDANLIDRLQRLPRLGDLLEREGWGLRQGFNRRGGYNKAQRRALLSEIPFLPTTIDEVWAYRFPGRRLTRSYGTAENERGMLVQDWPKHADEIFKGPRVVIHQTPLTEPPMLRAAFVSRSFTFHKELKGLFAPPKEQQLLKFVAAVLSSSIAYYYYFHTSLSWGVEAQPQVRKVDLLDLPLPLGDSARAAGLRSEVVELVDSISPTLSADKYRASLLSRRRQINDVLLKYYGLDEWEIDLVRDCETHLAQLIDGKTLARWDSQEKRGECRKYVERLTSALNRWAHGDAVTGTAYVSDDAGLGLVVLERGAQEAGSVEVLDDDDELGRLLKDVHMLLKRRGPSRRARDVMVFQGTSLYITKPLSRRHWTRTAALNDADMIAAALLSAPSD